MLDGEVLKEAERVARVRDLTHSYRGARALDAIDLDIPTGRMVGLIGPDGVGKSTLLALLAGARKLQSGTLEVLGGDMGRADHRRRVGPGIAYMPQGLGKNLYGELSIAENLAFFADLFELSRTQRESRIDLLTEATGLKPFLERPAGKLSGGMKQKLGLCCALIHQPDFVILDEPTTGVDPLSRRQFWELIGSIKDEYPRMSLLISTAYMEEAEAFDWLIAMDAGRIIGTGSPDALKAAAGSDDLEGAYVALLPGKEDREVKDLVIAPRKPSGEGRAGCCDRCQGADAAVR